MKVFTTFLFVVLACAAAAQYIWVSADLHAHTQYSDAVLLNDPSVATPASALDAAIGRGLLNVMAPSDHCDALTPAKWDATGDHCRTRTSEAFVALRACEWTNTTDKWCKWLTGTAGLPENDTGHGHINVFGTSACPFPETISKSLLNAVGESITAFYYWLAEQPDPFVVAQFNHPSLYDRSDHFNNFILPQISAHLYPRLVERMALIEVVSHGPSTEGIGSPDDAKAGNLYWYIKALQQGWRVAPTANSDAHFGGYGSKRNTFILVPKNEPLSEKVILEALRARRTSASEVGGMLAISTSEGSGGQVMGSTLLAAPTVLAFHYLNSVKDGFVQPTIVWVKPDGYELQALQRVAMKGTARGSMAVSAPADSFSCFMMVEQAGGRTVSAPIWFPKVQPGVVPPKMSGQTPDIGPLTNDFRLLKKALSLLGQHRNAVLAKLGVPHKTGGTAGYNLIWEYRMSSLASQAPYTRSFEGSCELKFDKKDTLDRVYFNYGGLDEAALIGQSKGFILKLGPSLREAKAFLPVTQFESPEMIRVQPGNSRNKTRWPGILRYIVGNITVDVVGVYTALPAHTIRTMNPRTGQLDEEYAWNKAVALDSLRISRIVVHNRRPNPGPFLVDSFEWQGSVTGYGRGLEEISRR